MSNPLIEKTYEKEQSDFLLQLFKLVTKTKVIEEMLFKTTPHIYAVYRKRQIFLPNDSVNLIETLEKKVVNNPFPKGIIFESNGIILFSESKYNELNDEPYLSNPIILLYEEPYLDPSVFEYIDTDELGIVKVEDSNKYITKKEFEKDKSSYTPVFNFTVHIYKLNIQNLYYEVTNVNPEDYVSLKGKKSLAARFESLMLCEDGSILEDGEEVGKIDVSKKTKMGKFEFLKYLMVKQGRERRNKLIPGQEIQASIGNKDIEKMYSKINTENLQDSNFRISKSGIGYMIKRK